MLVLFNPVAAPNVATHQKSLYVAFTISGGADSYTITGSDDHTIPIHLTNFTSAAGLESTAESLVGSMYLSSNSDGYTKAISLGTGQSFITSAPGGSGETTSTWGLTSITWLTTDLSFITTNLTSTDSTTTTWQLGTNTDRTGTMGSTFYVSTTADIGVFTTVTTSATWDNSPISYETHVYADTAAGKVLAVFIGSTGTNWIGNAAQWSTGDGVTPITSTNFNTLSIDTATTEAASVHFGASTFAETFTLFPPVSALTWQEIVTTVSIFEITQTTNTEDSASTYEITLPSTTLSEVSSSWDTSTVEFDVFGPDLISLSGVVACPTTVSRFFTRLSEGGTELDTYSALEVTYVTTTNESTRDTVGTGSFTSSTSATGLGFVLSSTITVSGSGYTTSVTFAGETFAQQVLHQLGIFGALTDEEGLAVQVSVVAPLHLRQYPNGGFQDMEHVGTDYPVCEGFDSISTGGPPYAFGMLGGVLVPTETDNTASDTTATDTSDTSTSGAVATGSRTSSYASDAQSPASTNGDSVKLLGGEAYRASAPETDFFGLGAGFWVSTNADVTSAEFSETTWNSSESTHSGGATRSLFESFPLNRWIDTTFSDMNATDYQLRVTEAMQAFNNSETTEQDSRTFSFPTA